jgi:hypothetical protein
MGYSSELWLMTINIADYISKIQCLMSLIADRANEAGLTNKVFLEDQRSILLSGAFAAAHRLQEEIYEEVVRKEGESYGLSNEMKLFGTCRNLVSVVCVGL